MSAAHLLEETDRLSEQKSWAKPCELEQARIVPAKKREIVPAIIIDLQNSGQCNHGKPQHGEEGESSEGKISSEWLSLNEAHQSECQERDQYRSSLQ